MRLKNSTTDKSERLKVARDLHDTLSQEIAALGYECDQAIALSAMGQARESLLSIRARLSLLGLVLRDELGELRDSERTFGSALSNFLTELTAMHTISMKNSIAPNFQIKDDAQLELFRAVREILINIVTHSMAQAVNIDSKKVHDGYLITITDDGVENESFSEDRAKTFHFGLAGLHERIANIKGVLTYSRENQINTYQISILG